MTQQKRLILVLGINVVMIASLLIVERASHSLGVLAAGGDYIFTASARSTGRVG